MASRCQAHPPPLPVVGDLLSLSKLFVALFLSRRRRSSAAASAREALFTSLPFSRCDLRLFRSTLVCACSSHDIVLSTHRRRAHAVHVPDSSYREISSAVTSYKIEIHMEIHVRSTYGRCSRMPWYVLCLPMLSLEPFLSPSTYGRQCATVYIWLSFVVAQPTRSVYCIFCFVHYANRVPGSGRDESK